jgi:hypothetical protein
MAQSQPDLPEPAMTTRYHLRLPEPDRARGPDPAFAFRSTGAEGIAEELQQALREPALFERWRACQDDPDSIDPGLAVSDPGARVTGEMHGRGVELIATTGLPGTVFKHRLRLLAGSNWELRDVSAA